MSRAKGGWSLRARLLLTLGLAAGCGGDASNQLGGSVKSSYNLDFDRVEVQKQMHNGSFIAVIVQYLYQPGTSKQRIPVKLTVSAPVVAGQEKNLVTEGAVTRVMPDGNEFPKAMKKATVTFDSLGEVGQNASGKFYVTFEADPQNNLKTEGTLNGDFSATLQQIGQ